MVEGLRQLVTGLRVLIVLTVILGVAYPLFTLAVARVGFDDQRNGSLVSGADGDVVGSALIGQQFAGDDWFAGRPSASDDDAQASGGSNDGPNSTDLADEIHQRRAEVAAREGVNPAAVPTDAVTVSGSGLDPYISVAYARLQVPQVAAARGLDQATVTALVDQHTRGRTLGFLGMPRVNVVELNLALSQRG